MTRTTSPQVTFAVDLVEPSRELLPTEKPKVSIEKLLEGYSNSVFVLPGEEKEEFTPRHATTTTLMSSSNRVFTA